jgi:hypothetical protein
MDNNVEIKSWVGSCSLGFSMFQWVCFIMGALWLPPKNAVFTLKKPWSIIPIALVLLKVNDLTKSYQLFFSFFSCTTSNLITNPNRCSKQSAKNVCSNSSFYSHKWVFDLQLFGLRCLKSSTQMDASNNIEKS